MNRKTVVELDLVGYGDTSRIVQENAGVDAVADLNKHIQGFIDTALTTIGAKREEVVLATTGDGAILAFENPNDAHSFAVEVHLATQKHNAGINNSSAHKWFRIGVATGDLYQETRSGSTKEVAGTVIATAVRLEGAARPGEVIADAETISFLSPNLRSLYGPKKKVKGKRIEEYSANRYSVVPEAGKKDFMPLLKLVLGAIITSLAIIVVVMYSLTHRSSARILDPGFNDYVEPIITVSGSSKNMGTSRKIWVVVKSGGENYYPHANAAQIAEGTDKWSSTGCIGPRADFDKEFEILAVSADMPSQTSLQDNGKSMCEDSLPALPPGVQILSRVKVTRNLQWNNKSR